METLFKAVRTEDVNLISSILNHPKVSCHISDTNVVIHPQIYWMLIYRDDVLMGMFIAHPHNDITYESHTCLLPASYGLYSKRSAHTFLQWMFDNTSCEKMITNVPEYNKLAYRFAKSIGGVDEGTNRKSFKKEGILMDQYVLGITKEEFICHG